MVCRILFAQVLFVIIAEIFIHKQYKFTNFSGNLVQMPIFSLKVRENRTEFILSLDKFMFFVITDSHNVDEI